MSGRLGFELSFEPFPRLVSPARRFVEEIIERVVSDPEDVFRIAMTAHELLENAIKYGTGKVATLSVTLTPNEGAMLAALRLSNDAAPLDIERLRHGIETLSSSPHPLEQYRDMMMKDVEETTESGLGLARIVVEGEMRLGLEVDRSRVTITASGSLSRGQA